MAASEEGITSEMLAAAERTVVSQVPSAPPPMSEER